MRDRILGLVALIVGLAMAWLGREHVPAFSYEPVGPRAFPWLLAAMMVVFGFVLLVHGQTQPADKSYTASERAARRILPGPVVFALCTVLAYGLVFQWLGFPIATVLLTLIVARLFDATWMQALVTALGLGMGLYLLFDKLLGVVLPLGLLRSVL